MCQLENISATRWTPYKKNRITGCVSQKCVNYKMSCRKYVREQYKSATIWVSYKMCQLHDLSVIIYKEQDLSVTRHEWPSWKISQHKMFQLQDVSVTRCVSCKIFQLQDINHLSYRYVSCKMFQIQDVLTTKYVSLLLRNVSAKISKLQDKSTSIYVSYNMCKLDDKSATKWVR